MNRTPSIIVVSLLFILTLPTAYSQIYMTEVMGDPVVGFPWNEAWDSNHDFYEDDDDDEFIEMVNIGAAYVDIGGWELRRDGAVRFTFETGTIMFPGSCIVLFGGGSLTNFNNIGWALGIAVPGGLDINDNGGQVFDLHDSAGVLVDSTGSLPSFSHAESLRRMTPLSLPASWSDHGNYGPPASEGRDNSTGANYIPAIILPPAKFRGNIRDLETVCTIDNSPGDGTLSFDVTASNPHNIFMQYRSPDNTLVNKPVSLLYQFLATADTGLLSSKVIPGDVIPGGFWLDFDPATGLPTIPTATGIAVVFDGLGLAGPAPFPQTLIGPANIGLTLSWYLPAGLISPGVSLIFQAVVWAPGTNGGLAFSHVVELAMVP